MSWTRNKLLSCLAPEDADMLRPHLEPVALSQGEVLFRGYETIHHVHFFEGGLSSEIAGLEQSKSTEVGCIGFEGFSAVPAVLSVDSTPHHAFMQCGGPALRIAVSRLRNAMDDSRTLRNLLLKYAHVFLIQVAATALADSRYEVAQRLARWVLMSQDRIGDELPLTHDFLSLMLGVRRPSVTDAIHRLEGVHAIKAERSLVVVRDRRKLEEIAGPTYGIPETEYERNIGFDFRK